MKTVLLFLLIIAFGVSTFFLSGFIANFSYSVVGCIYTSAGIFGISFITIGATGVSLALHFDWLLDLLG